MLQIFTSLLLHLDRQNALRKFVEQASSHSDWPEIHIACLLGLEEAVDKICEKDPLL